jgi:hypothetical protein
VDENTIVCLLDVSTNPKQSMIGHFDEIAVAKAIPEAIVRRSTEVAQQMVDEFWAREQSACAFIVGGPPGSGKSIVARIVAHRLKGILFTGLNTTRCSGDSVWGYISDYADDPETPLVLVFEEFDCALRSITRGEVHDTDECRVDTRCKASWNEFLTGLSRKTNVVLILTTNRTDEELLTIDCLGDASLLRPGRITRRFVIPALPPVDSAIDSAKDVDVDSASSADGSAIGSAIDSATSVLSSAAAARRRPGMKGRPWVP